MNKNIRDRVDADICDGMASQRAIQEAQAGVLFQGKDGSLFVPFSDLGYNRDLGYFQISQFPDQPNECVTDNPETIHLYHHENSLDTYVWRDAGGCLHHIGDIWHIADLHAAITAFLTNGKLDPKIINDDDPGWRRHFSISDAVSKAVESGWPPGEQTANTIRTAARRGAIAGAKQNASKRWIFEKKQFAEWLANSHSRRRTTPKESNHDRA